MEISGEHADKIYQAMHSCDGFLRQLKELAETAELDEQGHGVLLSDVTEMRSRISKWTDSLREIAFVYRKEKKVRANSV